jgi:hypothetical protein
LKAVVSAAEQGEKLPDVRDSHDPPGELPEMRNMRHIHVAVEATG